jgi:SNF2 family DNA or RNA helicase
MTLPTYHLEPENKNGKHYLNVRVVGSNPTTSSEKTALAFLLKHKECPFHILKLLGTTGRVFYLEKKVVVDPFTTLGFYLEADRQSGDEALVHGVWTLGNQKGLLHECTCVMPGEPAWMLQNGIIRAFHDEISSLFISGPKLLKGPELSSYLKITTDPFPFLTLSCRHGGFADLWFDYGAYGKVAAHDPSLTPWRNPQAEKGWEKDLLETNFLKKQMEKSHYYCPLDKVAKSLTFLLEIGWTIFDASGRKVLRQKKAELDAQFSEDQIEVRAKIYYDEHEADLKDLVGAFNRREHFVALSANTVALIDPEKFSQEWGDFVEEGVQIKKAQIGLLSQLLDKPDLIIREELRQKIAKMGKPTAPVVAGSTFQGTLFSYQNEGLQWLKWLEDGGFGGLLADEMGLGKTVQVLAFFSLLCFERPCLIVVPTSLVFHWKREIEKFLPDLVIYSHQGKDRLKEGLQEKQIILTSYAILRLDADLLQKVHYEAVVLDEGQTIKNPDSQIAGCVFRLQADLRLVITGTPIENRAEDLWSIFHFLQPDLLGERRAFQAEVLRGQMGSLYLERIKKKIRPFLLRRKKDDVALHLPPKLEQTVFVEMTEPQAEIYDRWLRNTKQGLLKKVSLDGAASHRMEILEAILRLRQLCAHPWLVKEGDGTSAKFERVMADLEEVVEEKRKVLVYSQFTQMLRLLQNAIREKGWNHVYLDGSTTDREDVVRKFQDDADVPIFLISLKAGGVGLNLTAADYVFLYDPWWNDAVERQAIDRAHRVGKQGTVIARRYITALSIEEKILRLKAHKMALSEQLLAFEAGAGPVSLGDLLELLS